MNEKKRAIENARKAVNTDDLDAGKTAAKDLEKGRGKRTGDDFGAGFGRNLKKAKNPFA